MLFFINLPLAVPITLSEQPPAVTCGLQLPAACAVAPPSVLSGAKSSNVCPRPPQPHTTQFSKPHFCFLCYNVLFVFIKITKTE